MKKLSVFLFHEVKSICHLVGRVDLKREERYAYMQISFKNFLLHCSSDTDFPHGAYTIETSHKLRGSQVLGTSDKVTQIWGLPLLFRGSQRHNLHVLWTLPAQHTLACHQLGSSPKSRVFIGIHMSA